MKPQSDTRTKLLQAGACLLPLGPAIYIMANPVAGAVVYVLGVVMLAMLNHHTQPDLNSIPPNRRLEVKRLVRNAWFSIIMLIVSATMMSMMVWDRTQGTNHFPWAQHNEWLIFCLIGALIQLYVSLRLDWVRRHLHMLGTAAILPLLMGCAMHKHELSYEVQGVTSFSQMEGQHLHLKVFKDSNFVDMDTALVTHGKFTFTGKTDSATMAILFLGTQGVMPIVIENGHLSMHLTEADPCISGSEMNDSLNTFIHRKTQIDNLLLDLPNLETRMLLDGVDMDEVARHLNAELQRLQQQNERLVVNFIKRNYNNVMAPGVFMIMAHAMPFPTMTPVIEDLVTNAPARFLNDPFVKLFLRQAKENDEALWHTSHTDNTSKEKE